MFFIDDINYTRYGYFEVNGIKTLSKFEAWELSKGNFDSIHFNFNDEHMAAFDWTIEPAEDIYELYRQRAQDIRNRYDYVVLMYSGGIDSHTILETFLSNGIKLDEICSFGNTDVEDKSTKMNQEVFNKAIPFVQSLELKKLGINYRFVEIGDMMINQYNDKQHYENFHYYTNGAANNWCIAVRSHVFKSTIPEHMKLTEQGKSVCYMWGFDKPSVGMNNGNWCFRYIDSLVDLGARQFNNRVILKEKFSNFHDEPFYISREFPQISIKQSHLLVKHMKTILDSDPNLKQFWELPNTGPYVEHHQGKYLDKKVVDGCIYPKAILSSFGDDKVRNSVIFTARDKWFNSANHTNTELFIDKMKKIIRQNRDFYRFRQDFPFSTRPVIGKPYVISKKDEG
jgi:hypothetical protein